MRLKYQLFITLLIASALLIALMLAISSWSFNRGFLGYVNDNEKAKLESLVARLATAYETDAGWDSIKDNRRRWHELITDYDVGRQPGQSRAANAPNRPPRSDRREDSRRSFDGTRLKKADRRSPPAAARWLVLANAEKMPIHGKSAPRNNMEWLAIESDAQTVGYLGYKRHTKLNRRVDQVFAQQQKRSFVYAALGMIVLSGLLSIPLGARIVKPLLTVNNAVDEINQGNFAFRVNTKRADELGDLARNVNNLGFTLEQNLAARQRWIAEISHELRTPLAVLQSEIEAIQDGIRDNNPAAIDSLHTEVMRLNRLINDLHQLSLSDIGGLEYKMQPLQLDLIVRQYLQANESKLKAAELTLHVNTINAPVTGDHQRLNQLLENLLQNSIRYTTSPGQLDVAVTTSADKAIIKWADSPPGVGDRDHLHLFDPLYRTDSSRNREHGGSGLGLAIVKKIVEAHGGAIKSQNSQPGGLEITISIPLLQERNA